MLYDDNVSLQSGQGNRGSGSGNSGTDSQRASYGSVSSAALTTGARTPTIETALTSLVTATRYFQDSSLDSDDLFLTLGGTRTGQRWTTGLVGQFIYDTTRSSDVEDTGEFINKNARREFYSIAPKVSHALTPRDRLTFATIYSYTHYDVEDLNDFSNVNAQFGWTHDLTERTNILANTSISKINRNGDGNDNSQYYNLLFGASHQYTKDLKINFSAGPSFVQNDSVRTGGGERQTERSFVVNYAFDGGLTYKLEERLDFKAIAGRAVTASGTTGAVNEDTRVTVAASYKLFPTMFLDTPLTYLHRDQVGGENDDESDTDSTPVTRDFVSFEPTLRWVFDPDWDLRVGYRVRWQSNGNENAVGNAALVSINYRLPRFTMSR